MRFGTELMRQADVLGGFTEDAPRVTRTYLSRQHRQAGEFLIGLMRDAGMTAGFDALGNIVGRYAAADAKAPVVMTGSHQDSVRNAGKYDGLFGIITAISCVKDLNTRGKRLPYTLEIVGFGDEEGVRFGATLIGSKAMAGNFDPVWLDKTDDAGTTMRQALVDFGGDPDGWRAIDRRGNDIVAYVESHIEQGPVLLNEGLAVGVVTAIAGASRLKVRVTGLAGHAGTVPMGARRDALDGGERNGAGRRALLRDAWRAGRHRRQDERAARGEQRHSAGRRIHRRRALERRCVASRGRRRHLGGLRRYPPPAQCRARRGAVLCRGRRALRCGTAAAVGRRDSCARHPRAASAQRRGTRRHGVCRRSRPPPCCSSAAATTASAIIRTKR